MKSKFILWVFIFSFSWANGQSLLEKIKRDLAKCTTISELKEIFTESKFYKDNHIVWIETEMLDFSIQQSNFDIFEWNGKEKGEQISFLILDILGKIFYKEILQRDKNYDLKPVYLNLDSLIFNPIGKSYELIFEKKIDLSRIRKIKYKFYDDFSTCTGYACSLAEGIINIFNLVKNNHREKLNNLLISIVPADQITGYYGLALLEIAGEILTEQEKKYMKRVEKSELKIYASSGCTDGDYRYILYFLMSLKPEYLHQLYSKE